MPVDVYLRDDKELVLKYRGEHEYEDDAISYFNGFYEKGGGPPREMKYEDWELETKSKILVLLATNINWEEIEIALIDFLKENHAALQMEE